MNTDFKSLCTPAKLYFVLTLISCIFMLFHNMNLLAIFSKLFFAFIWTYVLNWICKKGYKTISWFLVLLPFIMMVLSFFGLYNIKKHVIENMLKRENMVKQTI